MTDETQETRHLGTKGAAFATSRVGVLTTAALLSVAFFFQRTLAPDLRRLVEFVEGTLPWPARVADVALHPVVLTGIAVGLTLVLSWQRTATPWGRMARRLRQWPLLPAVNLYLILAITGASTTLVTLGSFGMTQRVAIQQRMNGGRPHVVKSLSERFHFWYNSGSANGTFDKGNFAAAREQAAFTLAVAPQFTDDMNFGEAISNGNLVLGRLALRDGDRAEAIRRLTAAGNSPGSARIQLWGPNMSLARDLLAVGEQRAVLDYFAQCRGLWTKGAGRDSLAAWTNIVRAGRIPRFGANLSY